MLSLLVVCCCIVLFAHNVRGDCETDCAIGNLPDFGEVGSAQWCTCCSDNCSGLKSFCKEEGFCVDQCFNIGDTCAGVPTSAPTPSPTPERVISESDLPGRGGNDDDDEDDGDNDSDNGGGGDDDEDVDGEPGDNNDGGGAVVIGAVVAAVLVASLVGVAVFVALRRRSAAGDESAAAVLTDDADDDTADTASGRSSQVQTYQALPVDPSTLDSAATSANNSAVQDDAASNQYAHLPVNTQVSGDTVVDDEDVDDDEYGKLALFVDVAGGDGKKKSKKSRSKAALDEPSDNDDSDDSDDDDGEPTVNRDGYGIISNLVRKETTQQYGAAELDDADEQDAAAAFQTCLPGDMAATARAAAADKKSNKGKKKSKSTVDLEAFKSARDPKRQASLSSFKSARDERAPNLGDDERHVPVAEPSLAKDDDELAHNAVRFALADDDGPERAAPVKQKKMSKKKSKSKSSLLDDGDNDDKGKLRRNKSSAL